MCFFVAGMLVPLFLWTFFFLFALHVICMSFQVILFFSETIQTFLLGFSVQILTYLLLTEATYSGVKKSDRPHLFIKGYSLLNITFVIL